MAKTPPKDKRPKQLLLDEEAVLRSQPRKPWDPDQARLPFDPMPDRVEPCLALLAKNVPSNGDWAFEIKWAATVERCMSSPAAFASRFPGDRGGSKGAYPTNDDPQRRSGCAG